MVPIHCKGVAHLAHTPKKVIIERVIIDPYCSSRYSVNTITDVSFTLVIYGENAFGAVGDFFAAIP